MIHNMFRIRKNNDKIKKEPSEMAGEEGN